MMLTSLAGLALLGWLIEQSWFYQGLGVDQRSNASGPATVPDGITGIHLFLQPLSSWFSRKHEFEADDYAANQVQCR